MEFNIGDKVVVKEFKDSPHRIIWNVLCVSREDGGITLQRDSHINTPIYYNQNPAAYELFSPEKEIDYMAITKDIVGG